jgi:hypothetical protein
MITVEFLITSLIVVLIPGTGVVFTVSTGLVQGRRGGVFAALGCTAGIVPHLLATVLGLAVRRRGVFAVPRVCDMEGQVRICRRAGVVEKHGHGHHRQSGPSQHPESEAHDLLPRFFAAVRGSGRILAARTIANVERRVHGDDFCSLRWLRTLGPRFSQGCHRVAAGSVLAALWLCCRVRWLGYSARAVRAIDAGRDQSDPRACSEIS